MSENSMVLLMVGSFVTLIFSLAYWSHKKEMKHKKAMRSASLLLGGNTADDIGRSVARHDLRHRILFKDYYSGEK